MDENILKLQSKLFTSLFEGIDKSRRLIVLDVGTAVPDTVEFFGNFRCRLHFADLFTAPIVHNQQNNTSEAALEKQFSRLLDFPEGTKFDVCMFWDFLNYLDAPALRAFNKALSPYIDRNTRGHGFGTLNKKTALVHQQYGVQQTDTLSVKQRNGKQLDCYPHPQAEMKDLLRCFNINRGLLLPDGRLEMLLHGLAA